MHVTEYVAFYFTYLHTITTSKPSPPEHANICWTSVEAQVCIKYFRRLPSFWQTPMDSSTAVRVWQRFMQASHCYLCPMECFEQPTDAAICPKMGTWCCSSQLTNLVRPYSWPGGHENWREIKGKTLRSISNIHNWWVEEKSKAVNRSLNDIHFIRGESQTICWTAVSSTKYNC